jgi:hypothetical protein
MRDDEDAVADFQPFTFMHQQSFHEQYLRSGASALRLMDVKGAPLCTAMSNLEERRRYDFVFGRLSAWARVQGNLKMTNDFCDIYLRQVVTHQSSTALAPVPVR